MNVKKQEQGGLGILPALAPLATPYVPFQKDQAPQYEAPVAFIKGTLFPGLDLPFMGMTNKQEKKMTPLTELQIMDFALHELALYLDTHMDDQEALALYRLYQQKNQEAREKYSKEFTPLTHGIPTAGPYKWLNEPWPWEYCMHRED